MQVFIRLRDDMIVLRLRGEEESAELRRGGCPRIYKDLHELAPGLLSFAVQNWRRFVYWGGMGESAE